MLLGGQVEPWDVEWAHEQAVKALEWLARNYPECSGSVRLGEHDKAVDEAAATGDREAYLEALRAYCGAGRDEELGVRKGAA
jgi:tetrahydromethanopterin S-methyltransferase subunit A